MNRRRFLRYSGGVAAAGAAGVLGYTFGIEPHWVEVVQRPLPVAALPPRLVGRRLIQISDWHVGPRVDDQFLTPPILPVRNRRYVSGEVPLASGRRLYINRGLGHLLQVRFNVRPEITVFTLTTSIL